MNTEFKKGREGFEATTDVEFPENGETSVIRIHTCKASRGGVRTSATAGKREHGGFSFMVFGDFHKQCATDPAARCTEKLVRLQHEFILSDAESVKALAIAFYAAKAIKEGAAA